MITKAYQNAANFFSVCVGKVLQKKWTLILDMSHNWVGYLIIHTFKKKKGGKFFRNFFSFSKCVSFHPAGSSAAGLNISCLLFNCPIF